MKNELDELSVMRLKKAQQSSEQEFYQEMSKMRERAIVGELLLNYAGW